MLTHVHLNVDVLLLNFKPERQHKAKQLKKAHSRRHKIFGIDLIEGSVEVISKSVKKLPAGPLLEGVRNLLQINLFANFTNRLISLWSFFAYL